MSSAKQGKNLLKSLLTAHRRLGCGCSDTHPTLPNVYHPMPKSRSKSKPKGRPEPEPDPPPSSSSSDGGKTSTTFSPTLLDCSDEPGPSRPSEKKMENSSPSNKIEDSIPVVKESEDPYEDFRESMMQMIMEKEIFSQEDLHHLLRRFLRLNSAAHRPLILRAFVDVCHSFVSDTDPHAAGFHRTCEQSSSSSM